MVRFLRFAIAVVFAIILLILLPIRIAVAFLHDVFESVYSWYSNVINRSGRD